MSLVNDLLKISNSNITNTCALLFLLKECENPLQIAKDSHNLSTKNNSVFAFEVNIQLTS